MNIKIDTDVYEIANRIKEIDRDYVIYFNTSKNQFEVHNLSQPDGSYCLAVPYKFLDERTLKLVRETNSANIELIINKINNDNELKENADIRGILNQFNDQLEQISKEDQ